MGHHRVSVNILQTDPATGRPLPATRVFLNYVTPPRDGLALVTLNEQQNAITLLAGVTYSLELRAITQFAIADWALAIDPSGHSSFSSGDGGNTYSSPAGPGHALRINAIPSAPV